MTNKHTKTWEEEKEFEEDVLQVDRVTRVTAGGRQLRFRATVVIGNRKGQVGIGTGKSNEVVSAVTKAVNQAKKDLVTIPLISGTIPHEVKVKYKSAYIHMMPAKQGTGVKAGGALRRIAELVGIRNLIAKRFGCNNRMTNALAAMLALKELASTPISDKVRERLEKETDPKGLMKGIEEREAKIAAEKKAAEEKARNEKGRDHRGGRAPRGRTGNAPRSANPTAKKE